MIAAVITVGSKYESLGAMKLSRWLERTGWTVEQLSAVYPIRDSHYDLYCFSVVFSWKLPDMVRMVQNVRCVSSAPIWIGGPAVTFHHRNFQYVKDETGIIPITGIDARFDGEQGQFPMTYFSRGCPAYTPACGLCPVPRIEGNAFTFYRNAIPAKLLLDNNLSALPEDYQDFIIQRYKQEWKGGKVDANSGFEPHSFTESTLNRWQKFPLAFWRFGYDDLSERDQALEMMRLLKFYGYKGEKVRVYTMIGNEPIADCVKRIREVIDSGFHPWPQRLRPLDWLGGPLPCRHDWDEPTLIAYQRFYSIAGLWKQMKPEEFYYQQRYPLTIGRKATP